MTRSRRRIPLVAHVIHALRMGGLENGLVNLVNRTPQTRYRHAIVCMTGHDRFAERIERDDVELFAIGKRPGKDPDAYRRLWQLFRRLRPDVAHTRNLAALDAHVPAFVAGVPARVHGEHGRDMVDLDGSNRRYRLLRRAMRPLIHHWIPLSADLEAYLRDDIGVPTGRVTRIRNGVDVSRFRPVPGAAERLRAAQGWHPDTTVVGWVGRMEPVKNPLGLVEAVASLVSDEPALRDRIGLVLVGDGSERGAVEQALSAAGLRDRAWLAGARDDVPELLAALDLFVLPSRAEGISNTILEALACGVPVLAYAVGGNAELLGNEGCGSILPPGDTAALAQAIGEWAGDSDRRRVSREVARRRAEREFSMEAMVAAYMDVYDRVLDRSGGRARAARQSGIV